LLQPSFRISTALTKSLPLEEPHTSQEKDKPVDIASCQELNFEDYMGHGTRSLEFKRGQGMYLTVHFKQDAVRYGCAFLNTEGGTLLIGVSDDGLVHGTHVDDQEEHNIRRLMDQVARQFNPPLCLDDYTLRFLPVIKDEEPDLKVVCLTFRAPPALSEPTLYRTNENNVFIRGDASVQGPLSDSDSEEYLGSSLPCPASPSTAAVPAGSEKNCSWFIYSRSATNDYFDNRLIG